MSKSDLNISRWLEAHSDRSAGLATLPQNAILADVAGDGDYRLVITDLKLDKDAKCRMKVYKGTLLTTDQVLQDIPNSLISFYTDHLEPRVPAVAVACASDIFIFKNNKPFYRFCIPSSPISPLESEVWKKFAEEPTANYEEIIQQLKTAPHYSLSPRSQELLALPSTKVAEFIVKYVNTQPPRCAPITCMTILNKSSRDKHGISCPVIATEFGNVYVLDPQTFAILHESNVCSTKATPSIMKTSGLYDVDFRIVIACREGYICTLRRGWLEGKMLLHLENDIVDMVINPSDNSIVLATSDKLVHCYTKKGQRLWSTKMINSITCLCLIPLKHLSTHLVAVGLKGGPIHLYHGRQPVDFTSVPDSPSVITFGQLGQEEHVMVVITLGGTINFKILKRTADFNLSNQENQSTPTLPSKPLPLPKRSKLFMEQNLRERQNALEMHQNFQQDLVRLRLTAARALAQNLSDQSGIGNEKEQIKLSAQVLGLGPKFTLILTLENMNSEKSVVGFTVVFHTKPSEYSLSTYIHQVPLIPPGLSYKMETKVTEILKDETEQTVNLSRGQLIRVFVIRKNQAQPVLAATINMPPTESPYLS